MQRHKLFSRNRHSRGQGSLWGCLAAITILLAGLACAKPQDSAAADAAGGGSDASALTPAPSESTAENLAYAEGALSQSEGSEGTHQVQDEELGGDEAPIDKLDLNSASRDALRAVPNLGERVRELEAHRPYLGIQQFRSEMSKHVDAAQIAEYERYLYVPIDYNRCDAETLQQLPSIDEEKAEVLIAARPFASRQAFFEALAVFLEETELELARSYTVVD